MRRGGGEGEKRGYWKGNPEGRGKGEGGGSNMWTCHLVSAWASPVTRLSLVTCLSTLARAMGWSSASVGPSSAAARLWTALKSRRVHCGGEIIQRRSQLAAGILAIASRKASKMAGRPRPARARRRREAEGASDGPGDQLAGLGGGRRPSAPWA